MVSSVNSSTRARKSWLPKRERILCSRSSRVSSSATGRGDARRPVHMASRTFARRLVHVVSIPQQDSAERAFNKLTRTFAAQISALKEYRSKGEQKMTVQHVHVAEGGQVIVGAVNAPSEGRGSSEKWRTTPCTWICTGHYVATRNRSGAGYSAERRQCAGLASVGCMGPLAGLPEATVTP